MRSSLPIILVALVLSVPVAAAQDHHPGYQQNSQSWLQQWDQWGGRFESWLDGHHHHGAGGSGPVAAPELDPAGAMGALTLLMGGLAVVRGRRSARKK
jgi:hypothetical protein